MNENECIGPGWLWLSLLACGSDIGYTFQQLSKTIADSLEQTQEYDAVDFSAANEGRHHFIILHCIYIITNQIGSSVVIRPA